MARQRNPERFLASYRRYVDEVLVPTEAAVRELLDRWQAPHYWRKYLSDGEIPTVPAPSPIHRTRVRIKRPESVVDKVLRRPEEFPKGLRTESLGAIPDLIGARIVVFCLTNLPLVDHEIRQSEEIEISRTRPPVAYLPSDLIQRFGLSHVEGRWKESGYTSLHYTVRLRRTAPGAKRRPWFELQVRTMAQDLWAEVEHILGYKPHKRTHLNATRALQMLGRELLLIDERVSFLFEELSRHQQAGAYDDGDPLNAENLAHVLARVHLGCAQREVDEILRLLWSRGIKTARELLEAATPTRIETINRTYLAEVGAYPADFEVIANLAVLRGARSQAEEVERIRSHISYLRAWAELRGVGDAEA